MRKTFLALMLVALAACGSVGGDTGACGAVQDGYAPYYSGTTFTYAGATVIGIPRERFMASLALAQSISGGPADAKLDGYVIGIAQPPGACIGWCDWGQKWVAVAPVMYECQWTVLAHELMHIELHDGGHTLPVWKVMDTYQNNPTRPCEY